MIFFFAFVLVDLISKSGASYTYRAAPIAKATTADSETHTTAATTTGFFYPAVVTGTHTSVATTSGPYDATESTTNANTETYTRAATFTDGTASAYTEVYTGVISTLSPTIGSFTTDASGMVEEDDRLIIH